MFSLNKKVAIAPFPPDARAPEVKQGIAVTARHRILPLKVVFRASDSPYLNGDTVWLRASDAEAPWAKEVYTIDQNQFILAPETSLLLLDPRSSERE